MSKLLEKKLGPEYLALWKVSKTKKLNYDVYNVLRDEVRRTKARVRNIHNIDLLEQKANMFNRPGSWAKAKQKDLIQLIYDDKGVDDIDIGQWISIEIELIMPNLLAEREFISFVRKNKWTKLVTIKDDGSIHLEKCSCEEEWDEDADEYVIHHNSDCDSDNVNSFGREIVVSFRYGEWEIVKSICDELNKLNCKVNKTCGLHVHFDMRDKEDGRKVSTIGQRVAKAVPALKQMLPKSRQNNEFCSRTINCYSDRDSGEGRYAFVNVKAYQRHKTLEIRGHSGTTDCTKIVNWIKILRLIMTKPNRTVLNTVEELILKISPDTELATYMLQRKAKFMVENRYGGDDVSNDNHEAETGQETFVELTYPVTLTRRPEADRIEFEFTLHGLDAASYSVGYQLVPRTDSTEAVTITDGTEETETTNQDEVA